MAHDVPDGVLLRHSYEERVTSDERVGRKDRQQRSKQHYNPSTGRKEGKEVNGNGCPVGCLTDALSSTGPAFGSAANHADS